MAFQNFVQQNMNFLKEKLFNTFGVWKIQRNEISDHVIYSPPQTAAGENNTVGLSQAAACDGTMITTTATNQGTVPGTLPTF